MSLLKDLWRSRKLIYQLGINDFKTKYAGSYLGITWGFINPIVVVLLYWFVFQIGFRTAAVDDFPFILWFVSGIVPWFFFSDALSNATNCLLEYSYLVKKIVFKISVLPIVKIISSLFVHLFFVAFLAFLFLLYGYKLDVYFLQVFYYSFCTFVFVLSLSYFTSSVVVFFKDLGHLISLLLQIGMWMTPIMWSYKMIPEKYHWILKLNPMFYITDGYRDAMINKIWFWQKYNQSAYFFILVAILFLIGAVTFKRLKPHFSDVL